MQDNRRKRTYLLAIRSADHLFANSHLDEAAKILERYLQQYPARKSVLRRLGRIRLAQGQPHLAVTLLNRALGRPGAELISPAA